VLRLMGDARLGCGNRGGRSRTRASAFGDHRQQGRRASPARASRFLLQL